MAAGGATFLVAVSISDRDPSILTWFLVLVLVGILAVGVLQRSRGD